MRLSELNPGQTGVVVKILGHGAFRKRMIEMGFIKGRVVDVVLDAPLHDPIKYKLMDYEVSLRRSEAALVEIVAVDDAHNPEPRKVAEVETDEYYLGDRLRAEKDSKVINVALIGNPNCGKTSLFNVASGASEHVGNYSGVTVDAKKGTFKRGDYTFNIVDLPGTYSLAGYSPEELYVRRYLKTETPDVIVNVVDASNLERNLYLTTELIDMDRSMVIDINMFDEFERNGNILDFKTLGQMIGVPIVPTTARTGDGVDSLFDTIVNVYEGKDNAVRHIHVNLGPFVEPGVQAVKDAIKADPSIAPHFSPRYLAIKLLERDSEVEKMFRHSPQRDHIFSIRDSQRSQIDNMLGDDDVTAAIANEKYGFIAGALAETLTPSKNPEKSALTHTIDSLVTNRALGFPIFIALMFTIFWLTFTIGSYPMTWIENIVTWLGSTVDSVLPAGPVKDMIVDGVIGGVGGVIVFLPNILILYFCISFMEDSGYMARAAFIMDKLMHRIGLHGKSFIPLIMGFGCNVPAIIASRSIESRSSRIITILINPFMSCSARVPIYVLLVGTFFPKCAPAVFLGIYVLGVVVAIITARLLRRFFFKADDTPFVMELPPYRIPTLKAMVRHTWSKGEQYLRKMGGLILVASIIVWALNYFPRHDEESSGYIETTQIDPAHDSYLQMIGKAISPALEPLGFSWKASVAALAGVPAKEIVVSTLGVLYAGDETVSESTLSTKLSQPSPITGRPDFDAATALSFMIFILLFCPCIATLTAIIRETGSWGYGIFSVVYNTAVAWIVAYGAYNLALLIF
ncbi:MAG: ferrous iron transport protein B [Muribaculaceae bacterium]|nr:ferrous iron transport protein B [Muribaculaceae bacterium]